MRVNDQLFSFAVFAHVARLRLTAAIGVDDALALCVRSAGDGSKLKGRKRGERAG